MWRAVPVPVCRVVRQTLEACEEHLGSTGLSAVQINCNELNCSTQPPPQLGHVEMNKIQDSRFKMFLFVTYTHRVCSEMKVAMLSRT